MVLAALTFSFPSLGYGAETILKLSDLSTQTSAKDLSVLKRTIRRVKGVRRANVDLGAGELYVTHGRTTRVTRLKRAVRRAGFTPVEPVPDVVIARSQRRRSQPLALSN